mgnify:FL=1
MRRGFYPKHLLLHEWLSRLTFEIELLLSLVPYLVPASGLEASYPRYIEGEEQQD